MCTFIIVLICSVILYSIQYTVLEISNLCKQHAGILHSSSIQVLCVNFVKVTPDDVWLILICNPMLDGDLLLVRRQTIGGIKAKCLSNALIGTYFSEIQPNYLYPNKINIEMPSSNSWPQCLCFNVLKVHLAYKLDTIACGVLLRLWRTKHFLIH